MKFTINKTIYTMWIHSQWNRNQISNMKDWIGWFYYSSYIQKKFSYRVLTLFGIHFGLTGISDQRAIRRYV